MVPFIKGCVLILIVKRENDRLSRYIVTELVILITGPYILRIYRDNATFFKIVKSFSHFIYNVDRFSIRSTLFFNTLMSLRFSKNFIKINFLKT